jgi:hypothetical protein
MLFQAIRIDPTFELTHRTGGGVADIFLGEVLSCSGGMLQLPNRPSIAVLPLVSIGSVATVF